MCTCPCALTTLFISWLWGTQSYQKFSCSIYFVVLPDHLAINLLGPRLLPVYLSKTSTPRPMCIYILNMNMHMLRKYPIWKLACTVEMLYFAWEDASKTTPGTLLMLKWPHVSEWFWTLKRTMNTLAKLKTRLSAGKWWICQTNFRRLWQSHPLWLEASLRSDWILAGN